MKRIPIWLQVSWEMKWYFLGFLSVFLLIAWAFVSVLLGLSNLLEHPELIGEFFGEIVKGFNSAI